MREIDTEKNLNLLEEYKKDNLRVNIKCFNCCNSNKYNKLMRSFNEISIHCAECGEYLGSICFVKPKKELKQDD